MRLLSGAVMAPLARTCTLASSGSAATSTIAEPTMTAAPAAVVDGRLRHGMRPGDIGRNRCLHALLATEGVVAGAGCRSTGTPTMSPRSTGSSCTGATTTLPLRAGTAGGGGRPCLTGLSVLTALGGLGLSSTLWPAVLAGRGGTGLGCVCIRRLLGMRHRRLRLGGLTGLPRLGTWRPWLGTTFRR